MNYAELSQAIQDYLEEGETSFITHIPDFVRQAEERIFRDVQVVDMIKHDTSSLTSGTRTIAKPSDYLSTYSYTVNDGAGSITSLLKKDDSFLFEAYPGTAVTGMPVFYADYESGTFAVAPTPDANYSVTLTYYYDPESIVTAGTSWLGDNAENALLAASLKEGYLYLKGAEDLLNTYENKYQDALNSLRGLGLIREKRDDYRDGELK